MLKSKLEPPSCSGLGDGGTTPWPQASAAKLRLEGDPDKGSRLKEILEKWSGFTVRPSVAAPLVHQRRNWDRRKIVENV